MNAKHSTPQRSRSASDKRGLHGGARAAGDQLSLSVNGVVATSTGGMTNWLHFRSGKARMTADLTFTEQSGVSKKVTRIKRNEGEYMVKRLGNNGFGLVVVLAAIVILGVAGAGWYLAERHHTAASNKTTATKQSSASAVSPSSSAPAVATDRYAGWKTYCDTDPANAKACFKYPGDWQPSQYGGFENAAQTAYIDYQGHDAKDQSGATAYITQIAQLNNTNLGLTIVGTIKDDVPSYTVYNTSDVANLSMGQNATLVWGNPTFAANGDKLNTFDASPGVVGAKAITTFAQAKAWFDSTEGKQCLTVLQSLYFN